MQAILDFREQIYDPNYFYLLHTDRAYFRFENATEWSVDGESAGALQEVSFTCLPRAVRILR
jgi:hypothetical protein